MLVGGTHDVLHTHTFDGLSVASEMVAEGVRHVVLDGAGRHRLVIRHGHALEKPAFLIEPEPAAATRLSALRALLCANMPTEARARCCAFEPTDNQRHRLTLMLRILDRLNEEPGRISMRALAREVIYARDIPERSIEWKSSYRRRQTQRLVRGARQMANGGYRRLLMGRAAFVTARPE